MNKEKPKRIQVTTTIDADILEKVRQLPEPLSKFLDRAIVNELTRSATATARLAEALQECFKAALEDALEDVLEDARSAGKKPSAHADEA